MNKINIQLSNILKKTFPGTKITKKKNPKAGDFQQWDSLGHLNFLLAVEKFFKIKFTMEQMIGLKGFHEISKAIKKKKN